MIEYIQIICDLKRHILWLIIMKNFMLTSRHPIQKLPNYWIYIFNVIIDPITRTEYYFLFAFISFDECIIWIIWLHIFNDQYIYIYIIVFYWECYKLSVIFLRFTSVLLYKINIIFLFYYHWMIILVMQINHFKIVLLMIKQCLISKSCLCNNCNGFLS